MTKELSIYSGGRIVSSIKNVGKTGQPHAKECNWPTVLHHAQKSAQNEVDFKTGGKTSIFSLCLTSFNYFHIVTIAF